MRTRSVLSALITSLTIVSSQNSQCHDYVLISIRGTYEVQGPSIGFIGMINTTLNTLPNGIEYDAIYPAAPEQTAYLGADDVVAYLEAGLQSCPSQKYAILGYSQGASAAAIALNNYTDTQSAGYQAIKAVLVIGNPYHRPNATVNVDQNGSDSTRSFGGVFNSSMGIPDAWYSSGKLLDICYYGDIVCGPQANNSSFALHLRYGLDQNVQRMGAQFLIEHLSSNGTSSGSSNNTSTPTSTTTGSQPNGTSSGLPGTSSTSAPSSITSGAAFPTPTGPNAASGIFPRSFLALIVCLVAVVATSGI